MKAGICSTPLNNTEPSGIRSYTEGLIEGLNIMNWGGTGVILVNHKSGGPFLNHEVIVPPMSSIFTDYLWYWNLSVMVSRGDVDVLHNPSGHLTNGDFAVPYVITVHDVIPYLHPEYSNIRQALLWKYAAKGCFQSADRIIADSDCTKWDLVSMGIEEEKIVVVYPGIQRYFFPRDDWAWVLDKYHLGRRFILTASDGSRRKNIQLVRRMMKHLPLCDLVVIDGRVPAEDVVALYNAASCFVYPSLYEGFGLPVAEAMACGCPVVCSDRASLPEVCGDAAIMFDPGDTIPAKLAGLVEAAISSDMRRKGIEQASKFTWARAVREIWRIYEDVTG